MELRLKLINAVVAAAANGNNYYKLSFADSSGKAVLMNTFDPEEGKKAMGLVGQNVIVTYEMNAKGYKDFKSCVLDSAAVNQTSLPNNNSTFYSPKSDPAAMYVSYCKDLFVAISSRTPVEISNDVIMEECIRIVSKFKEAFSNEPKKQ